MAKKQKTKTIKQKKVKINKAETPPIVAKTVSAPVLDEKTSKLAAKWAGYYNKAKSIQTEAYSMKNKYETETAISHKVLGWGYILDNKNDRLEVLFKDGIKYLISNYK